MASLRNPLRVAQGALLRGAYFKNVHSAQSSVQQRTRSSLLKPATSSSSTHPFSTSTSRMASSKSYLEAAKERRTIYQLNKTSPIPDSKIVEIIETAANVVPSAFNTQSTRLVTLLNKEHEVFWDQVHDVLKPIVPEEQWATTKARLDGFKAGKGTVLFFTDPEPMDTLKKKIPAYAHHYGDWAEQSNAMHQYFLWVALEAEGLGANLQHYNPLVDQKTQQHYNIPLEWKLRAQLVFGGKAGEAGPKETLPVEKKVFVHGAE